MVQTVKGDGMKTLREWRLERLLSVGELARRSGITKKTLIDLEYGRRSNAHYDTIRQVSAALDVQPAEITEFASVLEARSKNAA
jgi:transcriptional regulator with XRE-family HTH domain